MREMCGVGGTPRLGCRTGCGAGSPGWGGAWRGLGQGGDRTPRLRAGDGMWGGDVGQPPSPKCLICFSWRSTKVLCFCSFCSSVSSFSSAFTLKTLWGGGGRGTM